MQRQILRTIGLALLLAALMGCSGIPTSPPPSTSVATAGRPVLLTFGPQHFTNPSDWDKVFAGLDPPSGSDHAG
jgi:hypothetical protein